ncbi:MAG: response regulator, partial [Ekhidna sp.]|nr:response regulator [Ekhidna sp.]
GTSLSNGKIAFGGNQGVTVIDPIKFSLGSEEDKLEFTSLVFNGEEKAVVKMIPDDNQIELKHDENTFTVSFGLLDYINPDNHIYQYRLNDQDSWQELGTKNEVTLANLQAGDHRIFVKAADENGIWTQEQVLEIEVSPPLLRQWYFLLLYTIIGCIIVVGLFRFRSKQLRLEKDYAIEHIKTENIREKMDRETDFHNMRLMFFTNISHEFRTPLTLIIAPLEKFIQKGIVPSAEHLQLMYRNAERLRRLIGQILDFRKMEAGELKFEPNYGDIIKYTKECTQLFTQIAQQRNIDYEITFDSPSLLVSFDKDKYEKIIINLISNSFKYTEKGKVSMELSHQKLDNDKVKISLKIEDTGTGIEEEHLEHIFDRYYHVKTKLANSAGTGIGLALVKQLVELHDGTISASSSVNKGAMFHVTMILDAVKSADKEIESPNEDLVEESVSLSATVEAENEEEVEDHLPTLLLVEDNNDLREYINVEFRNIYNIVEASNGEEGFKSAIKNIPDIIISDISMPIMDGLEMTEQVKQDERTSHIPIILLTAHGSQVHQKKGFELGVEDFIVKPFSPEILELRVNNLLRSRKDLQDKFRKEFKVEPNGLPSSSMDQSFLNKAMSIIEENLSNSEFNASQFADEMCMSRVHLYRKLKALTNESVSGFVKMVRLKLAADLLRDKKMNIKEAAYTVGFSDPKYFSKCFKQHFGVKPSDFVDNPLNEENEL